MYVIKEIRKERNFKPVQNVKFTDRGKLMYSQVLKSRKKRENIKSSQKLKEALYMRASC